MLDLLAAAPTVPADRAAYLALVGHDAQRQALDPDGALLALAYRAAVPEVRERLRAVIARAGDADVIRVVVTGDQRDRVAEMSYDELDYLGHRLAEHRRWAELRRLALDLPLAAAMATARLVPAEQRTGEAGALLTALAGYSPTRLRATLERLPRQKVISTRRAGTTRASFSPDQAEVAVITSQIARQLTTVTETIQVGTGEKTLLFREQIASEDWCGVRDVTSFAHLGDEIFLMKKSLSDPSKISITRVRPRCEKIPLEGPQIVSNLGRASTGVVAFTVSGFAFIDRGSAHLRHLPVPRIAKAVEEVNGSQGSIPTESALQAGLHITTSPDTRLIAIATPQRLLLLDELGTVLDEKRAKWNVPTFLTPDSLALAERWTKHLRKAWRRSGSSEAPRDIGRLEGWAAIEALRGFSLDAIFAQTIGCRGFLSFIAGDPLLQPLPESQRRRIGGWGHRLVAVSPYADMVAAEKHEGGRTLGSGGMGSGPPPSPVSTWLEVHSPFLPSVPGALEPPLLHATRQQWHHVRELRRRIGDPDVREILELLDGCLAHRFEGDIALGADFLPAAGPTDIALDRGPAE
jgi:hypothetical protein